MQIIPAIDLYKDEYVSLFQGDFGRLTSYGNSPLLLAKKFTENGAKTIHIVDLEGLKNGLYSHLDFVKKIQEEFNLSVQTGGGLRDTKSIKLLLDAGIKRVIIGSFAIREPKLLKSLIDEYGTERFVIALDIRNSSHPDLLIEGWQTDAKISIWEIISQFSHYTGLRILSTIIARNGTLEGSDPEYYEKCLNHFSQLKWQASGGISSLSELKKLKKIGVDSVIIGKAFYQKIFTLKDALAEVQ